MGYGAATVAQNEEPRKTADQLTENTGVTLTTVPDSASSLRVIWDQPASSQGSAVTKYKVEWFDADAAHEGTPGIQTITTSAGGGRSVRGTFQLEFQGEVTGHLDYDASPVAVEQALNDLSTLRHVTVDPDRPSANGGYAWKVTFRVDSGPAGTT